MADAEAGPLQIFIFIGFMEVIGILNTRRADYEPGNFLGSSQWETGGVGEPSAGAEQRPLAMFARLACSSARTSLARARSRREVRGRVRIRRNLTLTLTPTLTLSPNPHPKPNPDPHPHPHPSPNPNPHQVFSSVPTVVFSGSA